MTDYILTMLALLVVGMTVLMAGIVLMNKEPGQRSYLAVKDSLAWGGSFLFSFGAEFLVLAKLF